MFIFLTFTGRSIGVRGGGGMGDGAAVEESVGHSFGASSATVSTT